jgi:hypothetical protein
MFAKSMIALMMFSTVQMPMQQESSFAQLLKGSQIDRLLQSTGKLQAQDASQFEENVTDNMASLQKIFDAALKKNSKLPESIWESMLAIVKKFPGQCRMDIDRTYVEESITHLNTPKYMVLLFMTLWSEHKEGCLPKGEQPQASPYGQGMNFIAAHIISKHEDANAANVFANAVKDYVKFSKSWKDPKWQYNMPVNQSIGKKKIFTRVAEWIAERYGFAHSAVALKAIKDWVPHFINPWFEGAFSRYFPKVMYAKFIDTVVATGKVDFMEYFVINVVQELAIAFEKELATMQLNVRQFFTEAALKKLLTRPSGSLKKTIEEGSQFVVMAILNRADGKRTLYAAHEMQAPLSETQIWNNAGLDDVQVIDALMQAANDRLKFCAYTCNRTIFSHLKKMGNRCFNLDAPRKWDSRFKRHELIGKNTENGANLNTRSLQDVLTGMGINLNRGFAMLVKDTLDDFRPMEQRAVRLADSIKDIKTELCDVEL